jgi:hypothetical protein
MLAAELLCEQCMWRCSRCGCHEFAGVCLRHNASRDIELLPSLKLTTNANALQITALLDKETQKPLPIWAVSRPTEHRPAELWVTPT